MGIQIAEGFLLALELFDDQGLDGVLEDVGVVTGVKGVTITQHGDLSDNGGGDVPPALWMMEA